MTKFNINNLNPFVHLDSIPNFQNLLKNEVLSSDKRNMWQSDNQPINLSFVVSLYPSSIVIFSRIAIMSHVVWSLFLSAIVLLYIFSAVHYIIFHCVSKRVEIDNNDN